AFEELLQRLRNKATPVTAARVTLLLRAVDALRQMIPQAIAGGDALSADQELLLTRLLAENKPAAEAPSAAAPCASTSTSSIRCSISRARSPWRTAGCARPSIRACPVAKPSKPRPIS